MAVTCVFMLSQVIILDTDIVFADDISKLWSKFSLFDDKQFLALVENLSDWYLSNSSQTSWPALVSFSRLVCLLALYLNMGHSLVYD